MTLERLKSDLRAQADQSRVKVLSSFFKTGKGDYGEGDVFLGIYVPKTRKVIEKYLDISLQDIASLLVEKVHEFRLAALLILVQKYARANEQGKEEIATFYIKNAKKVNNWDLVDSSAQFILGDFLFDKDKSILLKFAKSDDVWERRIAIIATFGFIKKDSFWETQKIAKLLLNDEHDLIQKAVGWMLREMGKRNQKVLEEFLNEHARDMPRTMLRYAIERLDAKKRKHYLSTGPFS